MSENIRFFEIVEALKKQKLLADYVQLASILNTNKAGVSDIKQGRKKLSVELIRSMKLSYPQINIEYIIMGEGDKFITPETKTIPEKTVNDNPVIDKLFDAIEKKDLKIEELLKDNARLEERLRLAQTDNSDFIDIAEDASTKSSLLHASHRATSAGAPLKE